MRRIAWLIILSIILMPAWAPAQQVRGVVRDSASNAPLGGAVVTALDSAGKSGLRTITSADGRFAIPADRSVAELRVVRIGFHPVDVALTADRVAPLDVHMVHLPPMLDLVRATDTELCPGSPELGVAFQIWQQVRAGLLATIVARDANPAMATTLKYATHLAPGSLLVREQTKTVNTGQTTRPFTASAKPSFFATAGYMLEDGPTRVYNAPDADVLLDDTFAATHCFTLRRFDGAHPGQVGVAFKPVAGRDTLVDVVGVIWVDATTPQLRSLDFAYTSLEPAAMAAKAGGYVNFRTMPNGISFIDRWNLRLASVAPPVMGVSRNMPSQISARRSERVQLVLRELIDAGGVVLDASWTDGTRFAAPRSSVSGVVMGKGTGSPVVGALVYLAGTPDTVTTDSVGHFRIGALPGKYIVEARDTALRAFIEPRKQSTAVQVREGADVTARLELAPLERVVGDVCRDQQVLPRTGFVIGYVGTSAGALPRDASVEVSFQHIADAGFTNMRQTTSLDEQGRFVVCGTPKDRKVRLALKRGGSVLADTSVIVKENESTHKLLWIVTPP